MAAIYQAYCTCILPSSRQPSPALSRRAQYLPQLNGSEQQRATPLAGPIPQPDQSSRQRAFLDDIIARRAKLVQVTYDRVAQNPKELTVLNDSKNWWECTNVHHRAGYVPHTILSVVNVDRNSSPQSLPPQDPSVHLDRMSSSQGNAVNRGAPSPLSPRPGMMSDDTPEYIKQRQGKRGEFRYF
ncbi:unnamed protein product [Gongylonema pulchrum]|uniref:SH3 domain-containing protein n=1 Tax=Gongylonema pulchrum TaxID=637853 RepID=A0A183DXU6_9BILA|nr:unnamed protein product [Gongylonema pulchrum]